MVKDEITVYTYHRNLEYFNTTKVLNRRDHRSAEFLQQFNFLVVYWEGRLNQKADALSRRRDYCHKGGSNSDQQPFFHLGQWQVQQERDLLRPQVLQTCQGVILQSSFLQGLKAAAENDQTYLSILKSVVKGEEKIDSNYGIEKELLLYKNQWYIPKHETLRKTIMEAEHDSRIAGHFRTYKTIGKVRANFFWPKMDEHIAEYVKTSDVCQRNKTIRQKKYGLLEPIDVSMRPWNAISMDFIVGLPVSEGYTKIWVIVDRFSKMAHFIPLTTEVPIKKLVLIFLQNVRQLYGLPESITSDRDTRFTSKFWISLMKLLQVKVNMSTAFHPETDGQTERVNQTLE